MSCSNCKKKPGVHPEGLCNACHGEAAKAPKMADHLNNLLERTGAKHRFTEQQVREALLENAKGGGTSKD